MLVKKFGDLLVLPPVKSFSSLLLETLLFYSFNLNFSF